MDGKLVKMPYLLIVGDMGRIRSRTISSRAAQYRFDAADNFARAERFYQVIVGAQFKACDAVILATTCGKHENGGGGPGTNAAADLHTMEAGEHQVKNNQVGMFARVKFQPGDAVTG